MPDDLAVQWQSSDKASSCSAFLYTKMAGFEADDVIGTVAKLAEARGIQVQI